MEIAGVLCSSRRLASKQGEGALISPHAHFWDSEKPPVSRKDLCDPHIFSPHLGLEIEIEGWAKPRTLPWELLS